MELKHVVVDGSNIATEGRSLPSLKQLDEAVRAFLDEYTVENLTVIVDATFGHRIDPSEKPEYEEAILAGELVTPPAGAIGRGDKFVLQIANRANASILSNDSFQEFHGEYTWLFDEGRLIGGKPVPGVGWVFLLRTPVRGPTSRRAVRDARGGSSGSDRGGRSGRGRGGRGRREPAPASAPESPAPEQANAKGAERVRKTPIEAVNEPLPFIEFVANHPVGSIVDGVVERFASHGAYIAAGGARCYIGLKFMGDPPPRSAKDVLTLGETRPFAVHAFDTPRRGIDLAMVAGYVPKPPAADDDASTGDDVAATDDDGAESTIADDNQTVVDAPAKPARSARRGGGRSSRRSTPAATDADAQPDGGADAQAEASAVDSADATRDLIVSQTGKDTDSAHDVSATRVADAKAPTVLSPTATKSAVDVHAQEAPVSAAKRAGAKKAPSKKKAAAKKAPAKKKAAAKKAPAKKKAAAKRATKKAPAKKKAAAKKATAKKAPAKKKAAAKRATKKAPAKKKAAAKKATAKKAPAKKKAAAKRATKKAPAKKKAAAKKAASRR